MAAVKKHTTFGEQLRQLRETAGMTLREVAANIEIDPSLLAKIERNQRQPTKHLIKNIADFNYDLPWNPNRIEQRFGRIHRIGQREVCHLWNLVAHGHPRGRC
jgi:transcriptional regulator with XRE-family HTH domain